MQQTNRVNIHSLNKYVRRLLTVIFHKSLNKELYAMHARALSIG